MMHFVFSWLIFTLNVLNILTQTLPSLKSSNNKPSITQFLVFSPSSETIIAFEPENGWILNEEKKLHLYVSGVNLKNNSFVFSNSPTECTSNHFVSPIYRLSSASIIKLNVQLQPISKTHSSIHLCLLPSIRAKVNQTLLHNGTILQGPYFTFVRDRASLPLAAKICLILMLFTISGFFSGLNLGLMSLSVNDLHLIAESENASMRYNAKRVLPLRKRGNFLLCSIVLANVLANSLGTVLLDSLVHGLFAVIGATIMIVLMGEIIPQAICSRYGLVIGARTHVITWGCMFVTGIISYPLGFILNKLLGQEVTASYTRDQIAGMITKVAADIEKPELDVITGVLGLRKKTVQEVMTWLPDVYMLDKERKTDAELLLDVHKHGYSRIPVYSNEKSNVIGIVKLRDFALITPEQYQLTVNHLLEFHTHAYGYAKTTDSLYDLMQEFLKARWHIALVQEPRTEENSVDLVHSTVGVITLEDVIEEMLQREIIEETDLFTDNRSKVQRKRAKTMDYTALIKRTVKGPSISPQLKVAVFQFLSTNVSQFTSGFISKEILKTLLHYNLYATIKRPGNQTDNSIYLYKKGFRYELFTLVIQGNATLESGVERIMSTVGPFSSFAAFALLGENKSVKDVHQFLDKFCTTNTKTNDMNRLLDEISPIFIPDYNLIVNSELHILQIHRLVWLAAVRATQGQRGNDPQQRRMQPEQLLSNALDEISSLTNIPIDKNNLTNFQQIFRNEKDMKKQQIQAANGNSMANAQPISSVFSAIHSLEVPEQTHANKSENNQRSATGAASIVCNPLLLSLPSYEPTTGNTANMANCNTSSASNSLNEGVSNSSMHIDQIFDGTHDQSINHDHGQEKERLIDQGEYTNDTQQRRAISASNLFAHRSDTNNPSLTDQNQTINNDLLDRPRRARSMLSATNCSPS